MSVEQKRLLINQLQKAIAIGDRCSSIQYSINLQVKSKDPTSHIECIKEVVQWVNSPELSSYFSEIERLSKNPSEAFEDWGGHTRLHANLNRLDAEASDELQKIIIDIKALAINLGFAKESELAHISNDCLYEGYLEAGVDYFQVLIRRVELSLGVEKTKKQQKNTSNQNRVLAVLLEHPDWTDEKIADAFNCSRKAVENIRQRLVIEGFEAALNRKVRKEPPKPKSIHILMTYLVAILGNHPTHTVGTLILGSLLIGFGIT